MPKLSTDPINWLQQQYNRAKSTISQGETKLDSPAISVVHKTAKKSYPPPPPQPPFDLGNFIKQRIQKRWRWIKTHYFISATIAIVIAAIIIGEYYEYRWWIHAGTFIGNWGTRIWSSFPVSVVVVSLILFLLLFEYKWLRHLHKGPLKLLHKLGQWSLTRWVTTIIIILIVFTLIQYFVSNANTLVFTSVEIWSEEGLGHTGETIAIQFRGNLNAIGAAPFDVVSLTSPNVPVVVNKARSSLSKLSLEDCSDIMLGPVSFLDRGEPISLSRSSDVHDDRGTGGQISLNTTVGTFNLPLELLEQTVRFILTLTSDYREFSAQIIPTSRPDETDLTSFSNSGTSQSDPEADSETNIIRIVVTASDGQSWTVEGSPENLPHLINFMAHRIQLDELNKSGRQPSNQIKSEELALALGNQAYTAGDFDTALIYYRLAEWFRPKDVTVQTMLGITLYQLSSMSPQEEAQILKVKALQTFIKANTQKPDNTDLYPYLACLFEETDRNHLAQEQIGRFNDTLEPDSIVARQERITELRNKPPLGPGRHLSVTTPSTDTFEIYYIANSRPHFRRWHSSAAIPDPTVGEEFRLQSITDEVRQISAVDDGIYYLTSDGLLKFIRRPPNDTSPLTIIDPNKLQFDAISLQLGEESNRLYTGGIRQILAVNKELLFLVDRFGRILRLRINIGSGTGGLDVKLESFIDFDARQIVLDGNTLYVLKENGTIWRISDPIDGNLSTGTYNGTSATEPESRSDQNTVTALQLVDDVNNREIVAANGIIYMLRTNGNIWRYVDQEGAEGTLKIDSGSQTSSIFIAPQGLFVLKNSGDVFLIRNPQDPNQNDIVPLVELPPANRVAINVIGSTLTALESGGQGDLFSRIYQPGQLINNDEDGDGLTTEEEIEAGTKINEPDSDGDTLLDGEELKTLSTNPLEEDSDSDGIWDGKELDLGLNPLDPDSDSDGISDGEELRRELNPLSPDTDSDGIPDGEELHRDLDPLNPDTDDDGIADGEELHRELDPLKSDTDGDGIPDAEDCPEEIATTFENLTDIPFQEQLGRPKKPLACPWAAWQRFETGVLLWRQDLALIYVLEPDATWFTADDTWHEGDDIDQDPSINPPESLYKPVRGFGKVWHEQQKVKESLGWGTTAESGFVAGIQEFTNGLAWYNRDAAIFIILLNNDTYQIR